MAGFVDSFANSTNLKTVYDTMVFVTIASRGGYIKNLIERGVATELKGQIGEGWFETVFTKSRGAAAGFARSTTAVATDGSLEHIGRRYDPPIPLRHRATYFWVRAEMDIHKAAAFYQTGTRMHFIDEASRRLSSMGAQAADFIEGALASPYSGRYIARVMAAADPLADGGNAGWVRVNPAQNVPREAHLEVYDSDGRVRSGLVLEVVQTNNAMDTEEILLRNVSTEVLGSGGAYTPTEGDYLAPRGGVSEGQMFVVSLDDIISANPYPPTYASGGLAQVDDPTFRAYVLNAAGSGSSNPVLLNPRMIRIFMTQLASQSSAYTTDQPIEFRSMSGMTSKGNPWELVMRPEHYNALILDAEPKRRYMDNPGRSTDPGMLVMDTGVDGYFIQMDQRIPPNTVYAVNYPSLLVSPPESLFQPAGDAFGFRQIPTKAKMEAMALYSFAVGARHRNSLGKITNVRGMTLAEAGIPS